LSTKTPWPVEVNRDCTVAADVPCRTCSYNLRTQPISGVCPECATPVRASIRGDWLVFSEPRYIERLAWGASLYLGCGLGAFASLIVLALLGRDPFVDAVAKIACFGCIVGVGVGAWWLTIADPSGVGERTSVMVLRQAARWLVIVGFMTQPLEFMRGQLAPSNVWGPMVYALVEGTFYARYAGVLCLLWYLGELSRRMDPRSPGSFRFTVWLMLGVIVAAQLQVSLFPRGVTCIAVPTFLVAVGSVFIMVVLLNALRKDLWFHVQMGRQLWPRKPKTVTPPIA
jgi:hypothetical protein